MSDRGFRNRSRNENVPKSGNNTMIIIISVIIVIALLAVIFTTLWSTSKNNKPKYECTEDSHCEEGRVCQNTKCVIPLVCESAPPTPQGVEVVFDALANTANLTWNASEGAVTYKIYRLTGSAGVSKNNYDETITTTALMYQFSGLAQGSHYFAVTSVNECGESDEGISDTYAPSCTVVPATPSAPLLLTNTDNCGNPEQYEEVDIQVTESTGTDPLNIVRGTGQKKIDAFFSAQEAPSGDFSAHLTCTASPVEYTMIHVSDAEAATLISPTGPTTLGSSIVVEWSPLLGAEEYVVVCISVDGDGIITQTGGMVAAPASSLEVVTDDGADLVFASVHGYKYCDKSAESAPGYHIPPGVPVPP
tara:strand:- start:294 stop:1379 length:1086 start_codon:yes stop_codon:yes gene_type:complete